MLAGEEARGERLGCGRGLGVGWWWWWCGDGHGSLWCARLYNPQQGGHGEEEEREERLADLVGAPPDAAMPARQRREEGVCEVGVGRTPRTVERLAGGFITPMFPFTKASNGSGRGETKREKEPKEMEGCTLRGVRAQSDGDGALAEVGLANERVDQRGLAALDRVLGKERKKERRRDVSAGSSQGLQGEEGGRTLAFWMTSRILSGESSRKPSPP